MGGTACKVKGPPSFLAPLVLSATLLGCSAAQAVLPIATPPSAKSPSATSPAPTQANATQPLATQTSTDAFHFAFTADSRDGYDTLAALSRQMAERKPAFAVFGGDLCPTFSIDCINSTWKPAMNGSGAGEPTPNGGILARTFVLRGNHDSGSLSAWQGLWDFSSTASRVGATNYAALVDDASYSFDYVNAHFAILDNPHGDIDTLTSAEISWLDSDLTAAEQRGQEHTFLFTHGPLYGVTTQHGSSKPSEVLVGVLNQHRISAAFAGHEHVTQYTCVTPRIEGGIISIPEFTIGRAGASAYAVVKYSDWHAEQDAFVDVEVNGSQFAVTVISQSGSALFSKTFGE